MSVVEYITFPSPTLIKAVAPELQQIVTQQFDTLSIWSSQIRMKKRTNYRGVKEYAVSNTYLTTDQ